LVSDSTTGSGGIAQRNAIAEVPAGSYTLFLLLRTLRADVAFCYYWLKPELA
jgi:hypothetical protein